MKTLSRKIAIGSTSTLPNRVVTPQSGREKRGSAELDADVILEEDSRRQHVHSPEPHGNDTHPLVRRSECKTGQESARR